MDVQAYLGQCAALIAEHGWMVQGVGGQPPFAYTIGLTEYGHPELLLTGLDPRRAQPLLNDLARPVKDTGRRYEPGERVPEIIKGYDVLVHGPIDPRQAQMNQALNLYGGIDALQVLWPDKNGIFPGQSGFSLGELEELAVLL